ncbi:MAG: RHS repeat-associated core domain-containing protein [Syntrophaceae bacterium]|nr:RHS repeat-associated core domain-containing protein [Syntrophaceae bacterium]
MRFWETPKYNSQELDKETGYYFYNARHYDAGIGRFVTPDTVIDGEYDTQGWNRYSYSKNNPIRYSDPTGHAVVDNNGMSSLGSLWNSVKETASDAVDAVKETASDIKNTIKESLTEAKDTIVGKIKSIGKTESPRDIVISVIEENYDDFNSQGQWSVGMRGHEIFDTKKGAFTVGDGDNGKKVWWREDNPSEGFEHPTDPGIYVKKKSPEGSRFPVALERIDDVGESSLREHRAYDSEGCVVTGLEEQGIEYNDESKRQIENGQKPEIEHKVIDRRDYFDQMLRPLPYNAN